MDVSKILTAGEWLEIEGVEGFEEFGAFRLKITPIDPLAYFDFQAAVKAIPEDLSEGEIKEKLGAFLSMVLSLVVDWDFESNGEKLACSPEAKEMYLKRLLWRKVRGKETLLARAVLDFAFNPGSFSKN